ARVEGQTARIDSRGNLVIENVQDVSRYDSDRREAGAALSLCIPPFCYGASSASLNLGEASIESDYASVTETAGIEAGDGGFDVRVAGDTDLAGGVIASSQGAVDAGRNHFETGGELRLADLENRAQYEGESYGVTVGLGADIADSNAGVGEDDGRADSATRAGITGIAGHREVRSGDDSGAIDPIFDAERVHDEIRAQVSITREFGQRAGATVRQWSATRRHALRSAQENATTDDRRKALRDEIRQVNLEERVMNVLVGAVTGQLGTATGKEALSAAAEEMRRISLENSSRFPGVTDGETTLTNLSGESVGVRGDGTKLGGTRLDLDTLCGSGYMRCKTQTDANGEPILDKNGMPKLELNSEGMVQFDPIAAGMELDEFLETPEGRDMAGLTGGIQGWKGTLFGVPYAPGSWQDQLIEAFAGSHDYIGGQLSGLYDEQGNARQGMSDAQSKAYDIWSGTAIPVATPFAAAELLPPEVWNGISIVLESAR
ncbi:MAG: hemagglutinin repeat-containing protein, partial [Pseudomonadota bacterium]